MFIHDMARTLKNPVHDTTPISTSAYHATFLPRISLQPWSHLLYPHLNIHGRPCLARSDCCDNSMPNNNSEVNLPRSKGGSARCSYFLNYNLLEWHFDGKLSVRICSSSKRWTVYFTHCLYAAEMHIHYPLSILCAVTAQYPMSNEPRRTVWTHNSVHLFALVTLVNVSMWQQQWLLNPFT
jgi:hypothetical protein